MIHQVLDIMKNLDVHLAVFAAEHGVWVYGLLFAIIFAETGVVVLPFLPGDSLLFTVGALAVQTPERAAVFNPWLISVVLIIAAILGDFVNYHLGKWIGPKLFCRQPGTQPADASFMVRTADRLLNRKHLDRANEFYVRYGGRAVVLGRFVPIVRTFVPFVAGAGAMNYGQFLVYNIVGAHLWVGVCVGAGVLFGNLEIVKKNFELVVVGIVAVSLLPVVIEIARDKLSKQKAAAASGTADA